MKTSFILLLTAFILAAIVPAATQSDYAIGPQDVMTITVYGEPDLSREYKVEQDGSLSFPLIGRVQAQAVPGRQPPGDGRLARSAPAADPVDVAEPGGHVRHRDPRRALPVEKGVSADDAADPDRFAGQGIAQPCRDAVIVDSFDRNYPRSWN